MPPPLVPDTRVEEADWFVSGLAGDRGATGRVESIVPHGYSAYARILHPAQSPGGTRVPWSEVAAFTGAELHPLAQFRSLAGWGPSDSGGRVGWPGGQPQQGSLDVDQFRTLCRILSDHTATSRCWLTIWEGWGYLPSQWRSTAPRIVQPYRAYYLFRRDLGEVVDFAVDVARLHGDSPSTAHLTRSAAAPPFAVRFLTGTPTQPTTNLDPGSSKDAAPVRVQSPSQWWAADRTWCAGSEIDFDSTLVAGSEDLVEQIVTDPHLEAFRAHLSDDLTGHGDTVNPRP